VASMVFMPAADRLLELALSPQRGVLLPGVHDALSAKIFSSSSSSPPPQCLFLSGFGVSAATLGVPDAGILTYREMEEAARNVIAAAKSPSVPGNKIPVVVDGDTGYGGSSNMRRAVRGLAAVGAAAITIEDQVFPKLCTYVAGEAVRVVDRATSIARIQTALAARQEALELDGNRILVVGRTDCRAALGFDEALERCLAYEKMGCDIVYAENLQSADEYRVLRDHITAPMILAQVQIYPGETNNQLYSLQDVADMDYNFALFGVTGLQAAVAAMQNAAVEMAAFGIVDEQPFLTFAEVREVVGFDDLEDFESRYYSE
jgi:2-methylisocitrate lyase-like PEP mutase family enzyme